MDNKMMVESLIEVAKNAGIKVRRSTGKFKSGTALVNDEPVIVLNRSTTDEVAARILARGLSDIGIDDIYIKPAIREYIESQTAEPGTEEDFQLNVE